MLIAVTSGEPAGVGPDIVLQLAGRVPTPLLVLGDYQLLSQRQQQLRLQVDLRRYQPGDMIEQSAKSLAVMDVPLKKHVRAGQPQTLNADSVRRQIRVATEMCLSKQCQAMVTAPVCKAALSTPEKIFRGQTEMIASLCRSSAVMMLTTRTAFRVALATTHLPLRDVAAAITAERLEYTVRTVERAMRHCLGVLQPRIAVCGLNPHAGEQGYLGREEQEIIEPLIAQLNRERMRIIGPLSADTAFVDHQRSRYDAIVCMYHDQGLPLVKHLGFGKVVNISLGLPIVRTSVDHGTAFDIAGSGQACADSLLAAIEQAKTIVDNIKRNEQEYYGSQGLSGNKS